VQLHDHETVSSTRRTRNGLRWLVTFLGFPLGGLVAELVVGPVDGLIAAFIGGAITGLILGAVQAWALRPLGIPTPAWIGSTGAGLAVGLTVGAAAVDYGTSMGDLALQGAICGVAVGIAQAIVLRARVGGVAFVWVPVLGACWVLGWVVTTAIGVDVESQYTVFGSSGALVVTIVTAVLPVLLTRRAARSVS
jgi:hypothetical protein